MKTIIHWVIIVTKYVLKQVELQTRAFKSMNDLTTFTNLMSNMNVNCKKFVNSSSNTAPEHTNQDECHYGGNGTIYNDTSELRQRIHAA